jgi:hypothetical protein
LALKPHVRLVANRRLEWPQPASDSGVVECGGLLYVVLHDRGGRIMAVYRVRPNGLLKGLKRWPGEIESLYR